MTAVKRADSREEQLLSLITQYELPLKRLCCAYLKDASLAEDAVQETFLKAYRTMDRFRGDSSAKTWLTRIAINCCKDMLRTPWFRHVDRRLDFSALPPPASNADPALIELAMLVEQLPERELSVVLLHYDQGMTTREIASVLRIPQATVSSRLVSARKRLRAAFEGRDDS